MRALVLILCAMAMVLGAPALADMFSDAQAQAAPPSSVPPTPCEQIIQTCDKAGFTRQTPKRMDGKDLDDDCFGQVINGHSVAGVAVSNQLIQQCLGSMPRKGQSSRVAHPH